MNVHIFDEYIWLLPVILLLIIWDSVWKLIALWKAARNNELAWFICIAIINTLGILPIIYLLVNRDKKKNIAAV